MNYSQNFMIQVTVLGLKDASWPTVILTSFYEMCALGALTSRVGMTHEKKLQRNLQ